MNSLQIKDIIYALLIHWHILWINSIMTVLRINLSLSRWLIRLKLNQVFYSLITRLLMDCILIVVLLSGRSPCYLLLINLSCQGFLVLMDHSLIYLLKLRYCFRLTILVIWHQIVFIVWVLCPWEVKLSGNNYLGP